MTACALAFVAGCATTSTRDGALPEVNLAFEKYTLGNGLDVILRKDDRAPIAAVNLWYHVGPANEVAGRTGFAHLFEHMMFQGSGHTAKDSYFPTMTSLGASDVNATTDFDRTNFFEQVPSNALERALWLESDRMGFLLDSLDQAELSNQQAVVRNERRENTEQPPYGLSQEATVQLLFPQGHPYHGNVIGSHADIQAARLDDVRDFFRMYYVPNNASLSIVGNIDIAATKAMIEKYFGGIARGADVPKPQVAVPHLSAEQRLTVTDAVELPRVAMAWVTPPAFAPGDAEAGFAANVLGGGKTSRLYEALVRRDRIAQAVSASVNSLAHGSMFQITAIPTPGHTADELEAAIQRELDRLAAEGPSPAEMTTAKTMFEAGTVFGLEHVSTVADQLNQYNQYLGDPGYLNRDLQRYEQVPASAVQRFVTEQLPRDRRVVVHTVPGPKVLPADPPAPPAPVAAEGPKPPSAQEWRNIAPELAPTPPPSLPGAQQFELANGLRVYLVEGHDLPLTSAQLVSRWGGLADPTGQPGLASFSADMLDEGTQTRDSQGIAREIEALGASLSTSASNESSSIGVSALTPRLDQAMTVMADVTLNPSFPPAEIERLREQSLVNLQRMRDDPSSVAGTVLSREMYGPAHPNGVTPDDLRKSLPTFTPEDLRRFHQAAFAPANSALILAGDVTEAQARELAEKHFGGWRGAGTQPPRPVAPTPSPERTFTVDRPGAGQTMVVMAQPGVALGDPDRLKLTVLNEVLGGAFGRLDSNLRERHGYTYHAESSLSSGRYDGVITLQTSAKTESTGAAVREMRAEVAALQSAPVSAEELQRAKDSLSRTLPADFATSGATASMVASLYVCDQPADYYQKLPAALAQITAEDLWAVARSHLRPSELKVVAVGDRGQIEAQLNGPEQGPIARRTVDAMPEKP